MADLNSTNDFRLFRRVRLDRAQALFETMRRLDGISAPEALALEQAVIAALARDRERFSDVLEASFAVSPAGEHAYRFSYAFPGFRVDRVGASRSALACAAPFGPAVVAIVQRALRAATDPAVEQPLIGVAWDRAGAPRHKVYLQFRDDAGAAAGALAGRALGMPDLAERVGDARLHMVGMDFGPGGLTGAKLYVAHAEVDPREPGVLGAAVGRAVPGRPVRNVLAVHRLTADDRDARALPAPSDVDFAIGDGEIAWEDVARAPEIAALLGRSRVAAELFGSFRIGVRRLSITTGPTAGITVYHCLREAEEA